MDASQAAGEVGTDRFRALFPQARGDPGTVRPATRLLGLEHEIGQFGAGTMTDFDVRHRAQRPVRRQGMARNLHDRAVARMLLGDDRNLAAGFVRDRAVYAG